jgi:hypothetical protein
MIMSDAIALLTSHADAARIAGFGIVTAIRTLEPALSVLIIRSGPLAETMVTAQW